MNINSLNFLNVNQNGRLTKKSPYLKPLEKDTVSFSGKIPVLKQSKIDHSAVSYENPKLDSKYVVNKAKYPVDTYKKFIESRMKELKCYPTELFWNEHFSEDQRRFPWKMHIFVDNYRDLEILADTVGKYLTDNDVLWKILSDRIGFKDMSDQQKGKGITIYPKNPETFKQIACDLDYIIKINGLTASGKSIKGDAPIGSSGRIFYRFELRSKDCTDSSGRKALDPDFSMDMDDDSDFKKYDIVYYQGTSERMSRYREFGMRPNGAEHLAPDMTVNDDPWRGFDTSNIKNNPSVSRLPKHNYTNVDTNSILLLPAYRDDSGKTKYIKLDFEDKKWKKILKNIKNDNSITIGRSGANINLGNEYKFISDNHLILTRKNGYFYIKDTSKNGTYTLRKI